MRRAACVLTVMLALMASACKKEPPPPVKPAEPIPAPKFLNVLSASACGTQCAPTGTVAEWAAGLAKQIDRLEVDVLMMQQVCKAQFLGLEKELAQRTTGRGAYTFIWHSTVENSKVCPRWGKTANAKDAANFGLFIAVRGSGAIGNADAIALPTPNPKAEPRVMFCGDARVGGQLPKVCTVNNELEAKAADVQVLKSAEFLNEFARQRPVIVGGNFNVRPTRPSILALYSQPWGKGLFEEVDYADKQFYGTKCPSSAPRCVTGVPTTEKAKVDYVFVSDAHFDIVGGGVEQEALPTAQHYPLTATLLAAGSQS